MFRALRNRSEVQVEWCVTSMEAWLLKQEHLKNYVIA
jgi:hypothetical protein